MSALQVAEKRIKELEARVYHARLAAEVNMQAPQILAVLVEMAGYSEILRGHVRKASTILPVTLAQQWREVLEAHWASAG